MLCKSHAESHKKGASMGRIVDHRRGDSGSAVLPQTLGILIAPPMRVGIGRDSDGSLPRGLGGSPMGAAKITSDRECRTAIAGSKISAMFFVAQRSLSCKPVERLG
jgi:hypothetical protein